MRGRPGALTTAATAMAVVLVGGPMLASPARAGEPVVVVRAGDTLTAIAARYRTSVERLAALNQVVDPNRILPGQELRLPTAATPPGAPAPDAPARRHVVRYGEHLTGIAARYNTTVAALIAANHLVSPNLIYPGQQLLIPGPGAAPSPGSSASNASGAAATRHTVRAGETLTGIAGRYNTSVAALVALNHLANASRIQAGQILLVAASAPAGAEWSADRFDASSQAQMGERAAVRDLIVAEARRLAVPVRLALAVGWQESGWRQGVVSSAGAVGVMQLIPDTADWVASAMLGTPIDIGSTSQNIHAGVTLLKHYLVRYQGNWRLTLAAYYQGQRAVDEHGIYPVSRPYIDSILVIEALLTP